MRDKIRSALLAPALAAFAVLPAAQALTRGAGRRHAHAPAVARNVRFDAGASATGIPFDFDDNSVFLEVRVNGSRPLKFGFDTGAGLTILNARTAKELNLKASGTTLNGRAVGGNVSGDVFQGITLGVRGETDRGADLEMVLQHTVPAVRPDDVLTALREVSDLSPTAPPLMTRRDSAMIRSPSRVTSTLLPTARRLARSMNTVLTLRPL